MASRDFIWRHALRLPGSVRNLPDGATLEVQAEGAPSALEELCTLLRAGPTGARVTAVDEMWGAAAGERGGFAI